LPLSNLDHYDTVYALSHSCDDKLAHDIQLFLLRQGVMNFLAWAGLELQSDWSQPPV
jgi:hypothetical protein